MRFHEWMGVRGFLRPANRLVSGEYPAGKHNFCPTKIPEPVAQLYL